MNDVWFIVAGYAVILGGLALYAATLLRRLGVARRESGSPPDHGEDRE
ncbi:MAG TPA: hypothetical protein VF071_07910 [Candidatus Limnocylindria bacterium]